jgi:hypothetical protein
MRRNREGDNRLQRARLVMAVIPVATGVVEVGWIGRDAAAAQADAALRRYVASVTTP